jgi:hypothetical protein
LIKRKQELLLFIKNIKNKLKLLFQQLASLFLLRNKFIHYNSFIHKYKEIIIFKLHKELFQIRKEKLRLNFNILKFKTIFLSHLNYSLKEIFNKYYYKNVNIVFNIVNLQSIVFNTDTITEFLK